MMCYYLNVHFQNQRVNALCGQKLELLTAEAGGLPSSCYEDAQGKHRWSSIHS